MEISAWGDSITYGEGDKEALGWIGRLRKELYETEHSVYNRGICGDTSEDVLKRFVIEVGSIEPELIFLAIGINDSKFPNGGSDNKVPFAAFQQNTEKLILEAKAKSSKVVLVGLTEVNERQIQSSSIFTNEVIAKYDAHLRELSQKEGVPFVNMQGVLDIETDLEDGLHPNASGYEKMFKVILPFVQ